jgi:hypothetical protein
MVGVEGSLRDSFNLYKENPKFVLPHLVEGILDVAIIISMVITVLLAIGVHVTEVILDDPEALASQISAGGMGLIVILIITFLFAILLITGKRWFWAGCIRSQSLWARCFHFLDNSLLSLVPAGFSCLYSFDPSWSCRII